MYVHVYIMIFSHQSLLYDSPLRIARRAPGPAPPAVPPKLPSDPLLTALCRRSPPDELLRARARPEAGSGGDCCDAGGTGDRILVGVDLPEPYSCCCCGRCHGSTWPSPRNCRKLRLVTTGCACTTRPVHPRPPFLASDTMDLSAAAMHSKTNSVDARACSGQEVEVSLSGVGGKQDSD